MANRYDSPDPLVICPLDKSHQILKSRLIFHLVKCKKNHNMENKATCVFNSTHIVDKSKLQAHHLACYDRREIIQYEAKYEGQDDTDKTPWGGVLPAQEPLPTHGEDWDDDVVVGTYDPIKANENKGLITTLMLAPKSQKKAWRKMQRLKMAQLDSRSKLSETQTPQDIQMEASPGAVATPTITTTSSSSSRENSEKMAQKQKTVQNSPFIYEFVTNMERLTVSDNVNNFNADDFPALRPPKMLSRGPKAHKGFRKHKSGTQVTPMSTYNL